MQVEYYAATCPVDTYSVPGFVFLLESEKEAQSAFDIISGTISTGSSTSYISLNDDQNGSYDLSLNAVTPENVLSFETHGVPASEVDQLLRLLEQVAYYFVVLGWKNADDSIEILDPSSNTVFKSQLILDGKWISATGTADLDWKQVHSQDAHFILGTYK